MNYNCQFAGLAAFVLTLVGLAGQTFAQVVPSGTVSLPGPAASNYQLDLTTWATHTGSTPGGGSVPDGTTSTYGAIDVVSPRDGSGRVFVSTQGGEIFGYDASGNSLGILLDISSTTATTGFINGDGAAAFRGLQYFDFHPDFNNPGTAGHRKVYTGFQTARSFDNFGVNADYRIQSFTQDFSSQRANRNQYTIGEWTVNGNTVDTSSFRQVYRFQAEGGNPHGLGEIAFNPNSNPGDSDYGLLYAAIGDGSTAGNDPPVANYLQDIDNPYGKILRLNPLQNGSDSFSVPASNPFFGQAGVAEEIYAFGYRDPQTFSFGKDANGEDVLITFDIGAANVEEISLTRSGGNYGFDRFEGTLEDPFGPGRQLLSGTTHSPPVAVLDHQVGGLAIAGGLRVSDPNDPNFQDKVLFTDLPTGKVLYADFPQLVQAEIDGTQAQIFEINAFTVDGGSLVTENAGSTFLSTGITFEDVIGQGRGDARFGHDEAGNVYIVSKQSNSIFRTGLVVSTGLPDMSTIPDPMPPGDTLVFMPFDGGAVGTTLADSSATGPGASGVVGFFDAFTNSGNTRYAAGLTGSLGSEGNSLRAGFGGNHRHRLIIDRTTAGWVASGLVDSGGFIGADNTTLFGSVLIANPFGAPAGFSGLEFASGDPNANRVLTIGEADANGADWVVVGPGQAGNAATPTNLALPTPNTTDTREIVFRIDYGVGGLDTVTLINADGTDGVTSATSDLTFSTLHLASFTGAPAVTYDDIRLGTTLGDVTYVESTTILGDVDLSGAVDFLDISPFITVLSSGPFQAEADCDLSGTVDFLDIAPFIAILSGSGS